MKKYVMGIITGLIITSLTVYAINTLIPALDIEYSSEYTNKTNVADALDELFLRNNNVKPTCPDNYTCSFLPNNLYARIETNSNGTSEDNNLDFSVDSKEDGVYEYTGVDIDGGNKKIYFYRGNVKNNNLIFADMCWKIVRTTSKGGTKIIYNGQPSQTGSCSNSGNNSQLAVQQFNPDADRKKYYMVGYVYEENKPHGTAESSTIKSYIEETWFKNTKLNTNSNISSLIDDVPVCIDRVAYTDSTGNTLLQTYTNGTFYYGGGIRFYNKRTPTLNCFDDNDVLSVTNGRLGYKVGMLTIDEVMLAGNTYDGTSANFLKSGGDYWIISPFNNRYIDVGGGYFPQLTHVVSNQVQTSYRVNDSYGVRPVISLVDSAEISSGDGTDDYPYIIKVANN